MKNKKNICEECGKDSMTCQHSMDYTVKKLKKAMEKAKREMPFELPTFRGYTVDKRLRQFRKASPEKGLEFVEFNSPRGQLLLVEMEEYFSFLYEDEGVK